MSAEAGSVKGAAVQSINDCISVLQGDLHQPGTPAIVLKLAASWQKLLSVISCDTPPCPATTSQLEGALEQTKGTEAPESVENEVDPSLNAAEGSELLQGDTEQEELEIHPQGSSENTFPESSRQELASGPHKTQSSGLLLMVTI